MKTFEESLAMGKANEHGQQDIACAPYQSIGKETTNQYRKVKPCIANTVLADDPDRVLSLKCLSRMMGNYHVRFLGESGVATPLTYPSLDTNRGAADSSPMNRRRHKDGGATNEGLR